MSARETLLLAVVEAPGPLTVQSPNQKSSCRLAGLIAALEAGYSTPSAFIAAFRKTLGTTPTMYFKMSASAGRDPR
jgi:hypothetical protein